MSNVGSRKRLMFRFALKWDLKGIALSTITH